MNIRQNLEILRKGGIVPVNPKAIGADPMPEERAVLLLAMAIEADKDPLYSVVSWVSQSVAADFYNAHGLNATLEKILELNPNGLA